MERMHPEYQSVNRVDVSKAIRTSWLFIPVNAVERLGIFRGMSFPW